jgi:serine protease inhibitor
MTVQHGGVARRDVLRALTLLGTPALALAGCGSGTTGSGGATVGADVQLVAATVPRAAADPALLPAAATAVTAFSADLYRAAAAAAPGANLVCSPYSVAVALAMTRSGARGRTADEVDRVLHSPSDGRLNPALNALTQRVSSFAGPVARGDGSRTELLLDVANSLWGQRGTQWQPAFLDALARYYGAGMRQVNYLDEQDREQARLSINHWTASQTHSRIKDLLPAGVLDELSRLVLVNAVYLKAGWLLPFEQRSTNVGTFTTAAGRSMRVPMMSGAEERGFQTGDGWQAVELPYQGGKLAMAVIVPEADRFDQVERELDGPALARLLTGFQPAGVALTLPCWTFRTRVTLNQVLSDLGMPTAFGVEADFSPMTATERLSIAAVLHQAFVAVDENGTEAAAATAVVMRAVSAIYRPTTLVVDRPFLFVIHDVGTGAPLFVGRVTDPSVTA